MKLHTPKSEKERHEADISQQEAALNKAKEAAVTFQREIGEPFPEKRTVKSSENGMKRRISRDFIHQAAGRARMLASKALGELQPMLECGRTGL